jgi:hypothetical protein
MFGWLAERPATSQAQQLRSPAAMTR